MAKLRRKPSSVVKAKAKSRARGPLPPVRVQKVLNTIQSNADVRVKVHETVGYLRQAVQARRGSFRAANNPRSRVQTPYGGSGDQHVDPWSQRLCRELARDLDRNGDIFRILMDAWAFAIVGSGVKVRPTTSDQKWNVLAARVIDELYRMVRGGVDSRGLRSMYGMQHDFVRSVGVDGECGFIKLDEDFGRLQAVESEQVVGKGGSYVVSNLDVNGVLLDEEGKVTGYNIAPFGTTGAIDYGKCEEYGEEEVEFCALRTRFSQTRGMPLLIANLEDWERLDSYRESEIIAAEQSSQIYGAIENVEGDWGTTGPWGNTRKGSGSSLRGGTTTDDGSTIDWQETVSGSIIIMPNGKRYVPINPQRPNRDASPFILEMLRQFCANAGLPYEIVYSDLRGMSWSVNRALVQMARDRIRVWQSRVFGPVFSQIYHWHIARLVEAKVLPKPPEDWQRHELAWPEISWPDEGKEYEAQAYGLLKGLTSRHRVHGPMWRELLQERATELKFASELAQTHNAEFPEFPVDPLYFLGFEDEQKKVDISKEDSFTDEAPADKQRRAAQGEDVSKPKDSPDQAEAPPKPNRMKVKHNAKTPR